MIFQVSYRICRAFGVMQPEHHVQDAMAMTTGLLIKADASIDRECHCLKSNALTSSHTLLSCHLVLAVVYSGLECSVKSLIPCYPGWDYI